ncbi:MAG: hypothetical protein ACI9G1_005926, partial [Pirellulaceae bacterium]
MLGKVSFRCYNTIWRANLTTAPKISFITLDIFRNDGSCRVEEPYRAEQRMPDWLATRPPFWSSCIHAFRRHKTAPTALANCFRGHTVRVSPQMHTLNVPRVTQLFPHQSNKLNPCDEYSDKDDMETSLHRQLKDIYAKADAQLEVPLGRYRIDVVSDGDLVEIQHGSLAAIRDKVADLLAQDHRVLVVKPIVARKYLVKQDAKSGQVVSRRLSPKRGTVVDLFDELVYFTRVFPHKNLAIEVPLVEIEEYRYPGHGRRRR